MKIIFEIFKFPYLSGKLPGRLTIAHQVEKPPSEENIDPCFSHLVLPVLYNVTEFARISICHMKIKSRRLFWSGEFYNTK